MDKVKETWLKIKDFYFEKCVLIYFTAWWYFNKVKDKFND